VWTDRKRVEVLTGACFSVADFKFCTLWSDVPDSSAPNHLRPACAVSDASLCITRDAVVGRFQTLPAPAFVNRSVKPSSILLAAPNILLRLLPAHATSTVCSHHHGADFMQGRSYLPYTQSLADTKVCLIQEFRLAKLNVLYKDTPTERIHVSLLSLRSLHRGLWHIN
jgi:hypothetical protein